MRIADAAANVLADDAHREKEHVAGHMGCIHDHEGNGGQRRAVLLSIFRGSEGRKVGHRSRFDDEKAWSRSVEVGSWEFARDLIEVIRFSPREA